MHVQLSPLKNTLLTQISPLVVVNSFQGEKVQSPPFLSKVNSVAPDHKRFSALR